VRPLGKASRQVARGRGIESRGNAVRGLEKESRSVGIAGAKGSSKAAGIKVGGDEVTT
jgi:hypothetical protein